MTRLRINSDGVAYFKCPGCNSLHTVHVAPSTSAQVWGFNGNASRPTITPSVLLTSHRWEPPVTPENLERWNAAPWEQMKVPYVCHSFVTDGRIQFLGDCTHALANQTVDLPDFPDLEGA
jgi:hypothetical protein